MAKQRRGQAVHGIFLLDKPSGISSNHALQQVKRLFNAQKAGHTGSLDPLASGMLPICLGEATKFSQYLLDADKVYEVTAHLGIKTDSGDSEGKVIEQQPVTLSQEDLMQVLSHYRGPQTQIPPMYSALKQGGRPLYELARQGISVERAPRPVHIYALDLLSFENEQFRLRVHCSKGTYIRSLIMDIGDDLHCGAHVIALRRLQCANFVESAMLSLEKLQQLLRPDFPTSFNQFLLPPVSAVADWPEIILEEKAVTAILQGQAVLISPSSAAGMVRLMSTTAEFLGIGELTVEGHIKPRRLVCVSA